jgi:hypothetical protein
VPHLMRIAEKSPAWIWPCGLRLSRRGAITIPCPKVVGVKI